MSGPVDPETLAHVQVLLDSFARLLGRELGSREGSAAAQAERLFRAPFDVVTGDTIEAVDLLDRQRRSIRSTGSWSRPTFFSPRSSPRSVEPTRPGQPSRGPVGSPRTCSTASRRSRIMRRCR